MTLTVDDRELIERLRTMCSHRGDGIATQYVNPDGPEAADRIEVLWDALKELTVSPSPDALRKARAALIQTEVP